MTSNWIRRIAVIMAVATGLVSAAVADVIVKANNTTNLDQVTSWIGVKVPGTNDIAQWDSTVTAANTVLLGGDLSWAGVRILNPGGGALINAGNTLTLGASGVDMSTANNNFTLWCALAIGADQSWNAGGKQFSAWGPAVNMGGHQVTITAGNKIQFKCPIIGGGTLVAAGGVTQLSNGTTASNTTVAVVAPATLTFDTASGAVAGIRALAARLDGGTLNVAGIASANTTDTVANALSVNSRLSTLTFPQVVTRNVQLRAGSLARTPGALALFNGTSLGKYPITSPLTNTANIWFDTTPTLLGGGFAPGTTTNGVLAGILGDTTAGGNGQGATGGLVTYDTTNGVRVLDTASEYASSIADGQTQLDNVRVVNASGTVFTNTLTAATTINSLSCIVTGSLVNSGIAINGAGALRLNSGVLYAVQTAIPTNTGNAITLNVPALDLNGQEGVIYFRKALQGSQIGGGGMLTINSAITNGNGLTIYANTDPIDFGGATTNTYAGTTTLNGGNLRLFKTVQNSAIPGDLTINAGSVYTGNGNQIRDTANITINGGSIQFAFSSGSGTGANETFNNLTMTGGSTGYASANGQTVTMLGSATIIGATTFTGPTRGTVLVVNSVTLTNGGMWIIGRANTANNTFESVTTFSNGVTFAQPMSGVYTSITVTAGSGANINGGKLVLAGGSVTLIGNSANTNTVLVSAPTGLGGTGVLALNGARTFDIGNGAADIDLAIMPIMVNNGATVGSLIKTGEGTLALNATNAYTGATTVSNGTLAVNGGLASPVTVISGATLTGMGWIAPTNATAITLVSGGIIDPGAAGAVGTLTVTGNVSFAASSQLRVDVGATGADLLAVSGSVSASGGPVTVSVVGGGAGPWLILSATSGITGSFTTAAPGLVVGKRNSNTELWLSRSQGTMFKVL